MRKIYVSILLVCIVFCGCEASLNETQTGTLAGSALGAGLGAIIGNQTGHAGAGTAIGAGAGALTGALIGEGMRRKDASKTTPQYQPTAQVYEQKAQEVQTVHTKYNPRTGKTFPESFKYDPEDGTELLYLR
jgi:uncharacterized protein YcfJ